MGNIKCPHCDEVFPKFYKTKGGKLRSGRKPLHYHIMHDHENDLRNDFSDFFLEVYENNELEIHG